MAERTFLWITEADVTSLMNMGEAIDALTEGLRLEAHSQAQNMVKTHTTWNGSTMHSIGAVFPDAGFAGVKSWCHTKGGATPLLLLFDSATGGLKAIVEAFALGQFRTGAASGVATDILADPHASEFALIGTGKQALAQVAAIVAVRPIRHVSVFGRDRDRCLRCAERISAECGIRVTAQKSIPEALEQATIVTLATRAQAPIISSEMVVRGTHINAIGAITPERAELSSDVLARASRIVADSVPQARHLSRELIDFVGDEPSKWSRVESLSELVARGSRRVGSDDVTVFKGMGMGISDLSLAVRIYALALKGNRGRTYPHPQAVSLQFGPAGTESAVER